MLGLPVFHILMEKHFLSISYTLSLNLKRNRFRRSFPKISAVDNWTNQWGNCSISSRNRPSHINSHVTRRNGNISINVKLESWIQLFNYSIEAEGEGEGAWGAFTCSFTLSSCSPTSSPSTLLTPTPLHPHTALTRGVGLALTLP